MSEVMINDFIANYIRNADHKRIRNISRENCLQSIWSGNTVPSTINPFPAECQSVSYSNGTIRAFRSVCISVPLKGISPAILYSGF